MFFGLWIPVVFGLTIESDRFVRETINPPKKAVRQVADYHLMVVYQGLINFVDSKDELAAVIAHEFGHLELQHTVMPNHNLYREYNADLISVYYLLKAGYNPCAISGLWKKMNQTMVNLYPTSHPLKVSRQFYMTMPNCSTYSPIKQRITAEDAQEIYENIAQHVEARIRFNTFFVINGAPIVNAYVVTPTKDEE